MRDHTVTVSFDDANVQLDAINDALHDAGYVVKGSRRVD